MVETRSALFCYIFSLNSVYNIIQSLYTEKDVYATKVHSLAGIVKSVCAVSGIDASISSEHTMNQIALLYPDIDMDNNNNGNNNNSNNNTSSNTNTSTINEIDTIRQNEQQEQEKRQLAVDKEIQIAIDTIESMPGLNDEEKSYRKQELLFQKKLES